MYINDYLVNLITCMKVYWRWYESPSVVEFTL